MSLAKVLSIIVIFPKNQLSASWIFPFYFFGLCFIYVYSDLQYFLLLPLCFVFLFLEPLSIWLVFFLFFFSVIFFLVFDLFLPNWLLFPMLNRWYRKGLISIFPILGENISIFHAQIWGVSKVFSYTFLTWKQFHSIHNFLIGFVCNQSCYHFTIFLSMEWENF